MTREESITYLTTAQKDDLVILTDEIIGRHMFISLKDFDDLYRSKTTSESTVYEQTRVVALVGAGASASITERAEKLVESLQSSEVFNSVRHKRTVDRLLYEAKHEIAEFETHLPAMTLTPEDEADIRSRISQIYSIRHPTILGYELLSHLLKHRYIDAIINFNWDELLDQSLEDELGIDEYREIISERDCREVEGNPSNPSYVPLHIKLHGTASDPETLRFTRQSYFMMPEMMKRVSMKIVGTQRCVVVCTGFGLNSPDILEILQNPAELIVYNLSATPISKDVKAELKESRKKKDKITSFKDICPTGEDWKDSDKVYATDYCLDSLVTILEDNAKNNSYPVRIRSVGRHKLISLLMQWEGYLSKDEYVDYLRDRTIIELILANIKGRGLISNNSLVNNRSGHYYSKYFLAAKDQKNARHDNWVFLCKAACLESVQQGNETYCAVGDVLTPSRENVTDSLGLEGIFQEQIRVFDVEKVIDKLAKVLSPKTKNRLIGEGKLNNILGEVNVNVVEILDSFQKDTEVELGTRGDLVCTKMFRSPKKIITYSAIEMLTKRMIDEAKRAVSPVRFSIIAETGFWLLEYIDDLKIIKDLSIDLVIGFKAHEQELKEALEDRISIYLLPWYRHNRHMTIYSEANRPIQGIYFVRRLRSAFINPVFVDGSDVLILFQSFIQLAIEASIRKVNELSWNTIKARIQGSHKMERGVFEKLPVSYEELDNFKEILNQHIGTLLLDDSNVENNVLKESNFPP